MNEEILNKIKIGDVVLTCGKGVHLSSLLIKLGSFFKKGYKERKWTHAAMYIGEGKVAEALPDGIVVRDLKEAYLNGNYELLFLRHKNAPQDKLKKAAEFCARAHKKKYDFRALIYFLLYNLTPPQIHFIWENDFIGELFNVNDSYFCSELVSNGFLDAEIYCFERDPYKIMPVEFNNELLFEKVDEVKFPEENKIIHTLKAALFWTIYLIMAVLLLIIVWGAAALIIMGIVGLIISTVNAIKTTVVKKKK